MSLLLKCIYSALLVGLVGIAVRELWTVWCDTRVYIGTFDVVSEGKEADVSDAFPKRIISAQTIIAQQLTEYQARHTTDGPSDTTYTIAGMTPLKLPPEALSGVDITVQSVNLRQVLTAVRRGFLAPDEVSGHVTERTGSVLAAVEWPKAPSLPDGSPALTKFLAPSRASQQEVAAYIACSITWARTTLAAFPRAQVCDFVAALGDLYSLEEKASTGAGLDKTQMETVRTRAAMLRSHYGESAVLPDIYRLRADLLDLLPEKDRNLDEIREAQMDRLRYAMLSSELEALPEATKRIAAFAMARPAIPLDKGVLKDIHENWAGLLKRRTADIGSAAAATGVVLGANDWPVGTGFIVGPGVMMTLSYVMDLARTAPNGGKPPRLCLGSSAADCGNLLSTGAILYDGKQENSDLVLVELKDHNLDLVPFLTIADPLPEPNTVVGHYAYVIGYPYQVGDAHVGDELPAEFVKRLLGEIGVRNVRKRLMPGRILAFRPLTDPIPGTVERNLFTSDISAPGGTAGGPLIDLETSKVIGVHSAGRWYPTLGMYTLAEPIRRGALDIINKRIRGDFAPQIGTAAAIPRIP